MMTEDNNRADRESFFWRSQDGLWLGARIWTPPAGAGRPDACPVLCLSGLSRNGRDFAVLAARLAAAGHRVIAMDYRGRGLSDRDPDWRNYAIAVEAQDIDAGLDALALGRCAVVGTSRGGLHAMLLALRRPATVAAIVLNDIGPQIEMAGLRRIASTIGNDMTAPDWRTAAERLRSAYCDQFPALEHIPLRSNRSERQEYAQVIESGAISYRSDDSTRRTSALGGEGQWLRLARQLYVEHGGLLRLDYDPDLRHTLADLDDDAPPADLWNVYGGLAATPLLVLRGETSDILSPATVARMLAEHPRAEAIVVPGQGHAPVLWEDAIQGRILDFIERATASG